MNKETVSYSQTVLLPKTSFPMRADLPKREPAMLKYWEKIDLYRAMLKKREGRPVYLLHDGPPYANGHIHIGHALNKILKDIIVKSRAMSGFNAPYVPGWDCHGLPIEHELLKSLKIGKRHVEDIPAFRLKAREFAGKFIDLQREEFKRLGVLGEWDNPYITMSPQYEGAVISVFLNLLRRGYIYRGKRTIYWCVSCETALAEAETEYKDKTSPSIYVRFRVVNQEEAGDSATSGKPLWLVIWTTTPWTLPANMAVSIAKEEEYSVIETAEGSYIVASKLADQFISACAIKCEKKTVIPTEKLLKLKYKAPLADRVNPVIHTDFVAMDTGVGLVHIAPGHGEDDYHAGLKWKLEIFCPVDEHGKFTAEAGKFAGKNVFDANPEVLAELKAAGDLLACGEISHSYPHCWRCKRPIIFRATEQWFLNVEHDGLREKLLSAIESVDWVPRGGHERIGSMVKNRPDWCLSRQRYWGTPVPVIFCAGCDEVQKDEKLLNAIETRAAKDGSDFWFSDPVEKIVPPGHKCPKCGGASFKKETDILDVWLDSGVSWKAVLQARNKEWFPAAMYLEGPDQHRGWFQSSLIPALAVEGKAPYKSVLTHGWVLDENGRAMHKSQGNVVAPQDVIAKYGAEVLRLWVALSDYSDDVRLSDKLLEVPTDTYRKIRNTIRYMLGNLWDFDKDNPAHKLEFARLQEMDKYMAYRLDAVNQAVRHSYGEFKLRNAIRGIADFCILDLSAFYLDALKDRLYTLGLNSAERRSAQTVLHEITVSLLKLMAPVLSFTAEEAWQELKVMRAGLGKAGFPESVFLEDFPQPLFGEPDSRLMAKWDKIRQVRETVMKSLEEARQKGVIGAPLEAKIIFRTSDGELRDFLNSTVTQWPAIAIVSDAQVEDGGGSALEVAVEHAGGEKCPRCWQWKKDIGSNSAHPQVCARCATVLESDKK